MCVLFHCSRTFLPDEKWESSNESSNGDYLFDGFVKFLETCCNVEVVAGHGSNAGNWRNPLLSFSPLDKDVSSPFSPLDKAPEQGDVSSSAAGTQALLYKVTFQSTISEEDRKRIKIGGDVCCGPADPKKPEAGPFFEFVNVDFSDLNFDCTKIAFEVRRIYSTGIPRRVVCVHGWLLCVCMYALVDARTTDPQCA